ncbi:MAG: hypothetical protein GY801_21745 [bacterium]|nr:hypothetical protein [bacterium]
MIVIILLLEFLVLIIIFSLLTVYGIRYIGSIVGRRVNEIHRQAEYILDYERVPTHWIREYHGDTAKQPDKQARWRKREKSRYLRKLKKLSQYFTNTPVFDDMSSRQ